MPEDAEHPSAHFEPLRRASGHRLIAGAALGALMWLVVLIATAWLLDYGDAIALGLLVAVAAFVFAFFVLALLHVLRRREASRYVEELRREEQLADSG